MQETTNYQLKKIELPDSPPDITVLNPNWDTIDTNLKKLSDEKAPKESPTFTGTVLVPDITAGDDSQKSANTAFVKAAIDNVTTDYQKAIDARLYVATTEPTNKNTKTVWADISAGADTSNNLTTILKRWNGSVWQRIVLKAENIIDFESAVKTILYKIADILQITWSIQQNGFFSFGPYLGGLILQWGIAIENGTVFFPLAMMSPYSVNITVNSTSQVYSTIRDIYITGFVWFAGSNTSPNGCWIACGK
jgi:hypothetical protein